MNAKAFNLSHFPRFYCFWSVLSFLSAFMPRRARLKGRSHTSHERKPAFRHFYQTLRDIFLFNLIKQLLFFSLRITPRIQLENLWLKFILRLPAQLEFIKKPARRA
jgi:hypothetical protein